MAISCQSCGREYDVALFQFGHTIWCTCGNRVGIAPRVRRLDELEPQRFAADAMLGRLARWLRLLGFDCSFDAEISDEGLVRHAVAEDRIVLTRDRRLPEEWWIRDVYLVRAQRVREQLLEVLRHFDLGARVRALSRCSECNHPLTAIARSTAAGRVPERVLERRSDFSECRGCSRIYWDGTHAARIRAVAAALAAESARGDSEAATP